MFDKEYIEEQLKNSGRKVKSIVLDEVDSTNVYMRNAAKSGAEEFTVVLSERQTAGKGRFDRRFFSPPCSGIYFSILLKPKFSPKHLPLLTSAAAVSVARSLEKLSGRRAGIKWVNDVYIDGKKVCGILSESSLCVGVEYAIVGIGINVCKPKEGFPEEIIGKAGYVFEKAEDKIRERVFIAVLADFLSEYDKIEEKDFLAEYRSRSTVIGKKIIVCGKDGEISDGYRAEAIAIDDECRLIVRGESGEELALNGGEVSISGGGTPLSR